MKKYFLILSLLIASEARAQFISGTLTNNGDTLVLPVENLGGVTFTQESSAGGWDGTFNYEANSIDGCPTTEYFAIQGLREGTMGLAFSDSGDITYMRRFDASGYACIRVRISARTSGNSTVTLRGSSSSNIIQTTTTIFGSGAAGVGAAVNPLNGLHVTIYDEAGSAAVVRNTDPLSNVNALAVREVDRGQSTMADSRPVVVASDQSAIPVSGTVTVTATDLDIRDLSFASDKVDVSGSTVTATVSATDLDIRNLAFATDKVDITGSSLAANQSVNVAQWGGTNTTLGQKAMSASVPVVMPNDFAQGSVSATLDSDQETLSIDLNGAGSVFCYITARTGGGSGSIVVFQSMTADDVNYQFTYGIKGWGGATPIWATSFEINAPTAAGDTWQIFPQAGANSIVLRVASYSSGGSVSLTCYTSNTNPPPWLSPSLILSGTNFTTGLYWNNAVSGVDVNTNLARSIPIALTNPTSGQNGVIVREVRTGQATMANSRPVVIASDQSALTTNPSTSNNVSISTNESVAAPTAAVWYLKRQWALPASAVAVPKRAWSSVTTAGSRTIIGIINNLGNLNLSTNTFTAANSVASPYFYGRLFGCVTTVMSATADTITPTYTDELGNSQAATGVAFASASPVGNCYEFPLATASGPVLDSGVRAVTAATDSAAPTGVVTFYGVNVLLESLGVANDLHDTSLDEGQLNANEQIAIILMQAATTAQQRGAGVTISLR